MNAQTYELLNDGSSLVAYVVSDTIVATIGADSGGRIYVSFRNQKSEFHSIYMPQTLSRVHFNVFTNQEAEQCAAFVPWMYSQLKQDADLEKEVFRVAAWRRLEIKQGYADALIQTVASVQKEIAELEQEVAKYS